MRYYSVREKTGKIHIVSKKIFKFIVYNEFCVVRTPEKYSARINEIGVYDGNGNLELCFISGKKPNFKKIKEKFYEYLKKAKKSK